MVLLLALVLVLLLLLLLNTTTSDAYSAVNNWKRHCQIDIRVCICAMPQYDDSFLLDCEKKRNVRSYRPHKRRFAISSGSGITKLSLPPTPPSPLLLHQQQQQYNGTIGKWRKWYFTWKQQNASSIPSTTATSTAAATMPSMPIYRSMCSPNSTNSTFNCKFSNSNNNDDDDDKIRPINIRIFMSFNSVNAVSLDEFVYLFAFRLQMFYTNAHRHSRFFSFAQRTWTMITWPTFI